MILGPCPCQACGRLLVWDGMFWLFLGTELIHVKPTCPGPRKGLPARFRIR